MKDILENMKNMLEFPNVQCSQNAVTAVGNLMIAVHKIGTQTAIDSEKHMIQQG